MTIVVIQTCDKCGKERDLREEMRSGQQLSTIAERGGWRKLHGADVCADCIVKFVTS